MHMTRRQSSTNGVSCVRRTRRWLILSTTSIVLHGPSSGPVFGFVVPQSPRRGCSTVSLLPTRRFLAPLQQPPVQDETSDLTTTSKPLPRADLREERVWFDPFNLPRSTDQLDLAAQITDTAKTASSAAADQQELGIWAARGLLLLVAAIWGTNFAVR
jgi:hypothetical protein